MITLHDYWMGRDRLYPADLTPTIVANATLLLQRVNGLLQKAAANNIAAGIDDDTGTPVASGWRPKSVNDTIPNASPNSLHLHGLAVDLRDGPERALARFCLGNADLLSTLALWLEDPRWTPTWVHLQAQPPRSGQRVFIPSDSPPLTAALPEQRASI